MQGPLPNLLVNLLLHPIPSPMPGLLPDSIHRQMPVSTPAPNTHPTQPIGSRSLIRSPAQQRASTSIVCLMDASWWAGNYPTRCTLAEQKKKGQPFPLSGKKPPTNECPYPRMALSSPAALGNQAPLQAPLKAQAQLPIASSNSKNCHWAIDQRYHVGSASQPHRIQHIDSTYRHSGRRPAWRLPVHCRANSRLRNHRTRQ